MRKYKFINIATFFTFASTAICLVSWIAFADPTIWTSEEGPSSSVDCTTEVEGGLDIDPYPTTTYTVQEFSSIDRLKLVGRLSRGIVKKGTYQDGSSRWYECGKRVPKSDVEDRAVLWSYHIVKASWEAFGKPEEVTKRFQSFVWGYSGTIYNESKFDECSIGRFARVFAERKGYITPNKRTLSRKRVEVLAFLNSIYSDLFKYTGIDLGPSQVLSKYKPNSSWEEMLSLSPGLYDDALEMKNRGEMYGTKRPWRYWPGVKSLWYDEKVTRWARQMGAKKSEI